MKGKSEFDREMDALHRHYKAQREAMFRAEMKEEWRLVSGKGEKAVVEYYTLKRIANLNEHGGDHFFSENTMRFLGDKLSNYKVLIHDGEIYIQRVRTPRYATPGVTFDSLYSFDPETGFVYEVKGCPKISH